MNIQPNGAVSDYSAIGALTAAQAQVHMLIKIDFGPHRRYVSHSQTPLQRSDKRNKEGVEMNRGRRTILLVVFLFAVSATAKVELAQPKPRPELIFTCVENRGPTNDSDEFRAVIFVKDAARWRQINLPKAKYTYASWEFAGRSKSKPAVWAIAQFGHGDIGPDLEIAYSANDGRTWRHQNSLPKVSRFAGFESFTMAPNGRGSLTIRIQDSPEPEHKDGYYTYTTIDSGRSWSKKPTYSQTAPTPPADDSLERLPLHESTSEVRCFDPRKPPR